MNTISNKTVVCVIGLGYVGLPLALAFANKFKVIGFDTNNQKVRELSKVTKKANLIFSDNPKEINKADFVIICVPTPITRTKKLDLSYIKKAAKTAGENIKEGAAVILESTVYPGVTEDVVKPVIEKESGLRCETGFELGYSPERINPGDTEHSIERVTKVVSGTNKETTNLIAELYINVVPKIFKAKNIKVAEASKVVENTQRDLNIALMNELSGIFERIGINTKDVIETAATKWNFQRCYPGLVGGYCIPVVPYFLVQRASEAGYIPKLILEGRAVNESMPRRVTQFITKFIKSNNKQAKDTKVLVMGLTYKENVADTREAPVWEIVKVLVKKGMQVSGYDPLLSSADIGGDKAGIRLLSSLKNISSIDCVLLSAGHDAFKSVTVDKLKAIMSEHSLLIDIPGFYDLKEVEKKGITYKTL